MWVWVDEGQGVDRAGRRRKRFLTPQEKYEIWLQLLRRESTIAEAAQRVGVDPGTTMKLRTGTSRALAGVPQAVEPTMDAKAAQARWKVVFGLIGNPYLGG